MSGSAEENPDAIELPASGDAAFSALMDALSPATDATPTAEGGEAGAAPAAGAGQPAAPSEGAGTPVAGVDTPGAGDAGKPGVPAEPAPGAPSAGAAEPAGTAGSLADAAGTVDALSLGAEWGKLSTALETNAAKEFQTAAFDEVRSEFPKYFETLEKHPRQLVGTQVPALVGEGMETLRDSADAAEWQEASKALLKKEILDRAVRAQEAAAPQLAMIHASVELFQNNVDLIPGTKQFDRELAERFVTLAKPYESRIDGKLHGYSIPPQPLITQLRTQLAAERAAAPAAPAGAATPAAPAGAATPAAPAAPQDGPQAGIASKAGSSGPDADDFSALFGTIGLGGMKI